MRAIRNTTATWIVLAVLGSGCGDKTKGTADGGSGNDPPPGVCSPTCPKVCDADSDCDTTRGEMCCGFGDDGKACVPAKQCPRFCAGDTECDTVSGEGCVRLTLLSPQSSCSPPKAAIRPCAGDGSCDTAKGEVCCGIYKEPICLPANRCPKICGSSNECDTKSGEVCCSALAAVDPSLSAPGLCVQPSKVSCPKTCTASGDCDTGKGQICCEGVCSTSCRKKCSTSSDCRNEICCTAPVARSPWYWGKFSTPGYDSCQCSGLEQSCLAPDTLRECEGCLWKSSSCSAKCKSKGFSSGACQTYGTSQTGCECALQPYPDFRRPPDQYVYSKKDKYPWLTPDLPITGCGTPFQAKTNSGKSCTIDPTACTADEVCIGITNASGATVGMCLGKCCANEANLQDPVNLCPTTSSTQASVCGLQMTGQPAMACAYICEVGSGSSTVKYSCPNSTDYDCVAVFTNDPTKLCVPKK